MLFYIKYWNIVNENLLLKSLIYFEDIKKEELILNNKLSFEKVKKELIKKVSNY